MHPAEASPMQHPVAMAALAGAGLAVVLAGAGWAYWGTDIFLATIMAGLAACL